MQIFPVLVVFGGEPVVLSVTDGNGRPITQASQIYVEPAADMAAQAFVETAGVATGATASTKGVIKALQAYQSSGPQDYWRIVDHKGGNLLELSQFQFDGTTGQHLRVSVFVV